MSGNTITRRAHHSDSAPAPAGSYSHAVEAGGLVFLSGQTPRDRDGVRHGGEPFAVQARMALENLEAVAQATGLSLRNAVKVNVYLRDPRDAKAFDAIYASYIGKPLPARTLTLSSFLDFAIEVDAVLVRDSD